MTQEQKSVRVVLKYERSQGRKATNVSKLHIGYDVVSRNRFIEVKSCPKKLPGYIAIYGKLLEKLGNKVSKYYIYIVWGTGKARRITILKPSVVFSNLQIHSEYRVRQKAYNKISSVVV
jgi:hypothetical protein